MFIVVPSYQYKETYVFSFSLLATLEIISVGAGLVKMLGVEAELFVTIDDSGVVRATVSSPFFSLM